MYVWLSLIGSQTTLQCDMLGFIMLCYNRMFPSLTVDWGSLKTLTHSIKCGATQNASSQKNDRAENGDIIPDFVDLPRNKKAFKKEWSWIVPHLTLSDGAALYRTLLETATCYRELVVESSVHPNIQLSQMKAWSPYCVNCTTSGYVPKLLKSSKKDSAS